MNDPDTRAAAVFRRQLGLITAEQTREVGISRRMIASRIDRGTWDRTLPRVYRNTASPLSRSQALLAALLWAGPATLLSAPTGLEVWGLARRSPRIHLVGDADTSRRHADLVVHRSQTLTTDDRARVGPLGVTSVARTIVDAAAFLGDDDLERVLEDALRRKLTTVRRLSECHDRLRGRGHRGSPAIGQLLAARDVDWVALNRELERRTWRLLVASDLPRAVRQHPVPLADFTVHLDFAWPDHLVALETDGWGPHNGRLAHHRDRERWSLLTAAGWRLQVVAWDHVVDRGPALLDRLAVLLR